MSPLAVRVAMSVGGAALVTAASLVEALTYREASLGSVLLPMAVLIAGAAAAPFLPAVGVVAAAVSFPFQVFLTPDSPGIGGTALITMMVLIAYGALRLRPRWSALGAAVAGLGAAASIVVDGESLFEFVFFAATMGGSWTLGWLLRRERRRGAELRELAAALAAERERSGRLAVVEERARISRELHDAVAHTVSVMTLQVGVLRRRLQETPEGEVLRSVEELGRRSVDELRRVVGALREESEDGNPLDPAPSLTRLDALVTELGRVGLTVTVRHDGDPTPLAPAMDTSAYRIVAEALTNVLRHAGTADAEVVLTHRREALGIAVLDRGAGAAAADAGDGHGLLHMRERAALFGGTLHAGPREGGGYGVEAVLPLAAAAVPA
ncbi:signal transduction histidine kinase [Actinomycetospora succinea]|uniref:histidine kinase n=1 Tax=Actinomycetospora succinea TaxID=663603 RepID=A0A4R6UX77_9PSEU|nr:histidine kinase [Actinomycetospora succinea]TDQ50165.1 signal transduction histidine kinase [Actinomycetospora succinea]